MILPLPDSSKTGEGGALNSRSPRRDDDPFEEATDFDTLESDLTTSRSMAQPYDAIVAEA